MLYIVETGFDDKENEDAFNAWYDGEKTDELLSIPGFNATQRFYDRNPSQVPYIAVHSIVGPELYATAAYKAAGGGTVGRWEETMKRGGWTRRLFAGVDYMPEVPMDRDLIMIDAGEGPDLDAEILWLDGLDWQQATQYEGAKALDSSVPRRGFAIVDPAVAAAITASPTVRVLKPISKWRKNA